jgi:hypothetical protein
MATAQGDAFADAAGKGTGLSLLQSLNPYDWPSCHNCELRALARRRDISVPPSGATQMGSIVTPPTARPPRHAKRARRRTRIRLRRRLRAAWRSLLKLIGQIMTSQGHAGRARADFMQQAAHEAREREDAIDASVGAMSAADIRRITEPR